jgi:hypothetical protein
VIAATTTQVVISSPEKIRIQPAPVSNEELMAEIGLEL